MRVRIRPAQCPDADLQPKLQREHHFGAKAGLDAGPDTPGAVSGCRFAAEATMRAPFSANARPGRRSGYNRHGVRTQIYADLQPKPQQEHRSAGQKRIRMRVWTDSNKKQQAEKTAKKTSTNILARSSLAILSFLAHCFLHAVSASCHILLIRTARAATFEESNFSTIVSKRF